ncbi:MAG TPA: NAD-dependent epimerase/dehydratase family protein, partial [Patescibacteria group bacterium]|nr:NAD-dependent epimerase/dehydratase family protein [Patescibacteria group bacterium]
MPRKNVIKKSVLSPTVLIAGGAGFIGSHLAEALLLQDVRVI